MSRMLRPDFATAGVGLVGKAQRENLARLHDWLVNEVGLPQDETVLATTNYQQGSFGRLPNHVLLVTNRRIAFTHDGGMRSVPFQDIDVSRVGIKAGLVQGELTLQTRQGESLRFKKGVSLAIQEVAGLVLSGAGHGVPAPVRTTTPAQDAPPKQRPQRGTTAKQAPPPSSSSVGGFGDQLLQVTVETAAPVRFEHTGSENFAVWEVSADGYQGDLLVNTIGNYRGTRLCGVQGPVAALEITSSGRWQVEFVDWDRVRRWESAVSGDGDDVLVLPQPTAGLVVASFDHRGHENFAVWAYGTSTDLLVNDLGAYSGQVRLPPGTEIVVIQADGPWQATRQ